MSHRFYVAILLKHIIKDINKKRSLESNCMLSHRGTKDIFKTNSMAGEIFRENSESETRIHDQKH